MPGRTEGFYQIYEMNLNSEIVFEFDVRSCGDLHSDEECFQKERGRKER